MVTAAAPISVIVTCKGRLGHLRQTLPALIRALPRAEVILVDYDCPERCGDWVEANAPGVTVVRAHDRPIFNIAKARNLGAAVASAPWLMFTDADVLLTAPLGAVLAEAVRAGTFLVTDPRPPILYGTVVVARADYQAVGGYDEVFEGWGTEDTDLLRRLEAHGVQASAFDAASVIGIDHADADRTAFHSLTKEINWTLNEVYAAAKDDLTRMGWAAERPERQALYDGLRSALAGADFDDRTVSHRVAFRREDFGGLDVVTSLKYDIHLRTRPRADAPPDAAGSD